MNERNLKPKEKCKRENMKKSVAKRGREAHLENVVFPFAKCVVLRGFKGVYEAVWKIVRPATTTE